MLTQGFYLALTSMLGLREEYPGGLFMAVGGGDARWDEEGPPTEPPPLALVAEIARHEILSPDIRFLDVDGQVTDDATTRLQMGSTFAEHEAVGLLRECGIFAGSANAEPGSGTLLVYFAHGALAKSDTMQLRRTVVIDLTPRAPVPGGRETRLLGNSSTEELHDLDNETPQCQLDQIRIDHGFFFETTEEATELGYDFCAYCFGRELSRR